MIPGFERELMGAAPGEKVNLRCRQRMRMVREIQMLYSKFSGDVWRHIP